jgi:hypothetical protein
MTIDLRDLFGVATDANDKVLMKLLSALKENQIAEFDYLKFKQSYKSLCALGMNEATAAKSAFLTASTMGLTKDKLLTTVQHYKNIMTREKEQFAVALKNQISSNIDSKILEIKKYQEKIEENSRKILQLQKEQVQLEEHIRQLTETAEIAKGKIEDTRLQFKTVFDTLYTEIEEDGQLYDGIL